MPSDDLVGINLDTMNDMKEQFEEKATEIKNKINEEKIALEVNTD